MESSTLLFTATWLFIYSIQLRERIARVVTHSSVTDPTARKQSSVQRIVYVLFTCSCTYLARIFCLSLLGVDLITGSSRTSRFTNLGWFIISNWIPTIIPVRVCRYIKSIWSQTSCYRDFYSCIQVEFLVPSPLIR